MQQEFPPSADDKNTEWDQKLDLSGENYGFGPTTPYQFPPMMPQQPKSRNWRTCLLIAGGFVMVCLVVCVCIGYVAYQVREVTLVVTYQQFLAQNQDVIATGLICPDSQAERFHETFIARYPGKVEIDAPEPSFDSDTHQVEVEGNLKHRGETVDYHAIYTIDTDGDFLFIFGCISEIRQILPPVPPFG